MTHNLNHDPKHRLCVRVDDSGVIEVRHRHRQDEPLFLVPGELDELVMRAPQIRAEAIAAFNRAVKREAS
jgi:hypothetical protein